MEKLSTLCNPLKIWNVAVVKPFDNDIFILGQSDKNLLVFNSVLLNSPLESHLGLDETE